MRTGTLAAVIGLALIGAAAAQTPPIPTTANRPQLAGEVLSWSGPQGGGASNGTYARQSLTLKPSGCVTTTSDGQIVADLDIHCSASLTKGVITIANNNVTVRENHIFETTGNQPNKYTIFINNGVTGTIIEDNLIDGHAEGGGGGNTSCISGDVGLGAPGVAQAIVRRNTCTRSEQMIRYVLGGPNLLPGSPYALAITENLDINMGGQDADGVEIYPFGTTGRVNNILIQYNLFNGRENKAGGSDSGVNLTTGSGLPVGTIGPNILIDHNWFVYWSKVHAIVADASSGGSLAFRLTNNGFLKGYMPNVFPLDGTHTISGNFIMETPTSTSGPAMPGQ